MIRLANMNDLSGVFKVYSCPTVLPTTPLGSIRRQDFGVFYKNLLEQSQFFIDQTDMICRGTGGFKTGQGHDAHMAHIFGVGVIKQYQARGVGSAIVEHLIEEIEEIGDIEQITLEVLEGNEVAINLWEKLGFKQHGHLKKARKYEDGSYRGLISMHKAM